jgi:ribosomal protein S6--L-glutamate ligase
VALGLPFGGVDLAIANWGVVFEVNVHPVIDVQGGLETLAIPLIQTHLSPRDQTLAAMR